MTDKKKGYDKKRALAVEYVARVYGVSEAWVRRCITSKETTGNADSIKATYQEKYKALTEIIG